MHDKPQSPKKLSAADWREIFQLPAFRELAKDNPLDWPEKEWIDELKGQYFGAKFTFTGAAGVTGNLFLVHLGNCEVDLPFVLYRNWNEDKIRDVSVETHGRAPGEGAALIPLKQWAQKHKLSLRDAEALVDNSKYSVETVAVARWERMVLADLVPNNHGSVSLNATARNKN